MEAAARAAAVSPARSDPGEEVVIDHDGLKINLVHEEPSVFSQLEAQTWWWWLLTSWHLTLDRGRVELMMTCSWSFLQACPTRRGQPPRPRSAPPALHLHFSFYFSFALFFFLFFCTFLFTFPFSLSLMGKLVLSPTLKLCICDLSFHTTLVVALIHRLNKIFTMLMLSWSMIFRFYFEHCGGHLTCGLS